MDSHKKKKTSTHQKIDKSDNEMYSDDVVFEEDGSSVAKMKKLKKKLDACTTERQEYLNGWQRAKADLVNFRKDQATLLKGLSDQAQGELITELLPALDSFTMAFGNEEAWNSVDQNWRVGVEYIHSQLVDILKRNGLVELDPIGESFDPKYHDSYEMVETKNKKEDGTIVEVVQKGYLHKGKVIRAARVKVAHYKPK